MVAAGAYSGGGGLVDNFLVKRVGLVWGGGFFEEGGNSRIYGSTVH